VSLGASHNANDAARASAFAIPNRLAHLLVGAMGGVWQLIERRARSS
jgi:hypothetical protein